MIIFAALIADWWGLTNAMALALSAFVWGAMLRANRDGIDRTADAAAQQSTALVKTLWKLADGSLLVMYVPRGVLTECLLSSPRVADLAAYKIYRFVA